MKHVLVVVFSNPGLVPHHREAGTYQPAVGLVPTNALVSIHGVPGLSAIRKLSWEIAFPAANRSGADGLLLPPTLAFCSPTRIPG